MTRLGGYGSYDQWHKNTVRINQLFVPVAEEACVCWQACGRVCLHYSPVCEPYGAKLHDVMRMTVCSCLRTQTKVCAGVGVCVSVCGGCKCVCLCSTCVRACVCVKLLHNICVLECALDVALCVLLHTGAPNLINK